MLSNLTSVVGIRGNELVTVPKLLGVFESRQPIVSLSPLLWNLSSDQNVVRTKTI